MLKFEICNPFTGVVQFTAEIDCENSAEKSVKIGLAVKWAIKNDANLSGADLRDANLSGANLSGANLSDANLRDADLRYANLSGADLRYANLRYANLSGADLSGANLRYANLSGADLRDANLSGADLRDANLSGANLSDANLSGANLSGANLSGANLSDARIWNTIGDRRHIKSLQIEDYAISYTSDVLQIGCKRYPITDWWGFSDEEIGNMDNKALAFWQKWKDWVKDLIEMRSPAEPTGWAEKQQNGKQISI